MKKPPLSTVKERFSSKEKLVSAIESLKSDKLWLDRVNDEKGLSRVSNAKLLRLHDLLKDAKERFGSRDKLIASILTLEKRAKDSGYKLRLERYPLPRLLDLHRAATLRAKRVQPAAKKAGSKKKRARSRKAKQKARAA